MQGDPASPVIFKIVMDAVVRAVLDEVCGTQDSQHRLVYFAGERKLVFYANNGMIAGRDHEWVQNILKVTLAMFRRLGLGTNLDKTKSMVCTPGFIWDKWSEEAYKLRTIG